MPLIMPIKELRKTSEISDQAIYEPKLEIENGAKGVIMSGNLNQMHKEFTVSIIKKKFMELFEKKGLEKIKVNEICELCGISRTAFYHYFDDKYSVLESICDEILEHLTEMNVNMHTIRISDTDTSMPLWIETATYISEKRDFILPLISIPGDQHFIHRWRNLIQETIKRRLLADHFKDMEKLDLISYTLAASTISLYEYWFRYQPDLSPEEIARLGSQLLWSSFYYFQKN